MITNKYFDLMCYDRPEDSIIHIYTKNGEIYFRLGNVVYDLFGHDVLYIEDKMVLNDYLINMEDVQCIVFELDENLKREIKKSQNSSIVNNKEDKIKMSV